MKNIKLLLILFCFVVLVSGCYAGIGGEATDSSHDEEISIDDDNNEEGERADMELEPEVLEIDVDDDGTGDINNPESMTEDDYKDIAKAANELFEDVTGENNGKTKGSCNAIPAKSTCVDYLGSYWENYDYLKLNCEGPETTPSQNTCPYNAVGGCKTGAGTIMEMIIWEYCSGGTPVCGESIKYAQMACDANPMSFWVAQP